MIHSKLANMRQIGMGSCWQRRWVKVGFTSSMNQRLQPISNSDLLKPHHMSLSLILLLQVKTSMTGYQTEPFVRKTLRLQGLITQCAGLRFYMMVPQQSQALQRLDSTGRRRTGSYSSPLLNSLLRNTRQLGHFSWQHSIDRAVWIRPLSY